MNIRELAGFTKPYSQINREERNYAAIFYATLLHGSNLEKFIDVSGSPYKNIDEDFGVYFEYSFLRDIWANIQGERANEIKKLIIKENLKIKDIDHLLNKNVEEFNKYFGVAGEPSKDYIQSPGRWSLSKFNQNIKSDDDFVKVCRFKWAFNIKPDLVIHLNSEEAICIEVKHSSGVGCYPSKSEEKEIFTKRHEGNLVKQTELQTYMMKELLGIKTHFVIIATKQTKSDTHDTFSWESIFKVLDVSFLPKYATDMLAVIGAIQ